MRLPNDTGKFSHNWKWIELAHYDQKEKKVVRKMTTHNNKRVAETVEWKDVPRYVARYNNTGLYTSVFHYNHTDYTKGTRLGSLYFDLDNKADANVSRSDSRLLVNHLLQFIPEIAIQIYFTGQKGFHVECEAMALGLTGSNSLPETFRFIANDLKVVLGLTTLDFAVYDLRRMWRLPNSIHQSTGLYKRHLVKGDLETGMDHILQLAKTPSDYEIPEQEFSLSANEWYRDYSYSLEKSKLVKTYTTKDLLERSNKHGTSVLRQVSDKEKDFNPKELFDNCPSLLRLWKKAETTHHLEHEERLFLCSILSYSEEAIFYLHEILRNCTDYDENKSRAHIEDWVKRREMDIGGRPYSCSRANSVGVGCGDCEERMEAKKKWVKVGDSWLESDEKALISPVRWAYKR